jgi:hypothetical protein
MSWCRAHSGTCDQILLPVGMLLSESCGLVSVGLPLWQEDGSAICSAITQWSESLRTHNHTLLSHLRLSQPGGPGSHIYIPQEQGGPVKPPGIGFVMWGYFMTDGLSVSMSWYRAPLWDLRPDITSCRNVAVWNLQFCFCGAPSLTRTGLQFAVQSLNGLSRSEPVTILHCLMWDSPQPGRPDSRIYIPQEQGGPDIHPGHWVPFTSPLATRRARVEVF